MWECVNEKMAKLPLMDEELLSRELGVLLSHVKQIGKPLYGAPALPRWSERVSSVWHVESRIPSDTGTELCAIEAKIDALAADLLASLPPPRCEIEKSPCELAVISAQIREVQTLLEAQSLACAQGTEDPTGINNSPRAVATARLHALGARVRSRSPPSARKASTTQIDLLSRSEVRVGPTWTLGCPKRGTRFTDVAAQLARSTQRSSGSLRVRKASRQRWRAEREAQIASLTQPEQIE